MLSLEHACLKLGGHPCEQPSFEVGGGLNVWDRQADRADHRSVAVEDFRTAPAPGKVPLKSAKLCAVQDTKRIQPRQFFGIGSMVGCGLTVCA